jgi:hypothetical protein
LPAEALFWRCWPAPPAAGSMAAACLLRFGGIRETEKADWAKPSTGPGPLGSMHFTKRASGINRFALALPTPEA